MVKRFPLFPQKLQFLWTKMKASATDGFCLNVGFIVVTGIAISILMARIMIWAGISLEYLEDIRWGASTLLFGINLHKLIDWMIGGRITEEGTFGKERMNKAFIVRNWQPPPLGWVKINVDASVQHQDIGDATIGGVVRDERGAWIMGFQARVASSTSAVRAKLLAIWKGLWLSKQKGFQRVIIELDSSKALRLLQEADETDPNFDIIHSVCVLMEEGYCEYEFCYVLGEANLCADLMAKEAWHSACNEEFIHTPPASVQNEIQKDLVKCRFVWSQKWGLVTKALIPGLLVLSVLVSKSNEAQG